MTSCGKLFLIGHMAPWKTDHSEYKERTGMIYIGIDVGGTTIKAGAVDESGTILFKDSRPTGVERGYEAMIKDMAMLATWQRQRIVSRA